MEIQGSSFFLGVFVGFVAALYILPWRSDGFNKPNINPPPTHPRPPPPPNPPPRKP